MVSAHSTHQRQKIVPPRPVPPDIKARLIALADKYETSAFSMGDPSCVLRRYGQLRDTECAAFLMAVLSFGRRDQFLPRALGLLDLAGEHPAEWIEKDKWRADFDPVKTSEKFYRFYSYDDMRCVLRTLESILQEYGSLGEAVRQTGGFYCLDTPAPISPPPDPALVISNLFSHCRVVSHGSSSAHKRTRMFLRWMVRTGSPVDLGLWTWIDPRDLVIPLDTHVLQTAISLGLLCPNSRADGKTALELTSTLSHVWPLDPCRGDFALFGLGVELTP